MNAWKSSVRYQAKQLSTRQIEEQLVTKLQEWVDGHFGEPYSEGNDSEIDELVELYFEQFAWITPEEHQYGPPGFETYEEYEAALQEYEEFCGWLEAARQRILVPDTQKRLTTSQRRARGLTESKKIYI